MSAREKTGLNCLTIQLMPSRLKGTSCTTIIINRTKTERNLRLARELLSLGVSTWFFVVTEIARH